MEIPTYELRTGFDMPALGLGTWQLTGEKCKFAVKKALELGYRHIDTAEIYENEEEIGQALQNFPREELFLTSKVMQQHLRYEDVLTSCENSLRKLKTSYLDLYLIHWPHSSVPLQETFKAMKKLKEEGKIRSFGVSNFDLSLMEKSLEKEILPLTVNQVEFHPYLYQEKLLRFCEEHNVLLTAYSPLARGKILQDETLKELGEKYRKTPAQISLKWCLQKGAIVIPKASSEGHLKENLQIWNWKISPKDIKKIDSITQTKRYVDPFGFFS